MDNSLVSALKDGALEVLSQLAPGKHNSFSSVTDVLGRRYVISSWMYWAVHSLGSTPIRLK